MFPPSVGPTASGVVRNNFGPINQIGLPRAWTRTIAHTGLIPAARTYAYARTRKSAHRRKGPEGDSNGVREQPLAAPVIPSDHGAVRAPWSLGEGTQAHCTEGVEIVGEVQPLVHEVHEPVHLLDRSEVGLARDPSPAHEVVREKDIEVDHVCDEIEVCHADGPWNIVPVRRCLRPQVSRDSLRSSTPHSRCEGWGRLTVLVAGADPVATGRCRPPLSSDRPFRRGSVTTYARSRLRQPGASSV